MNSCDNWRTTHATCNPFYPNLKTYSIIFINCLDRIVRWKINQAWESWKKFKASWMGHGYVLHGDTWNMCMWGRNFKLYMFCWVVCFGYWIARASKLVSSCPPKFNMFQWVVGFKVQVSKDMFWGGAISYNRNRHQTIIKTWYIFWHQPMEGHVLLVFQNSHQTTLNTFTTCC